MEDTTKEILEEINDETDELNISEMEIEGILNLNKFKNFDHYNYILWLKKALIKISNSKKI